MGLGQDDKGFFQRIGLFDAGRAGSQVLHIIQFPTAVQLRSELLLGHPSRDAQRGLDKPAVEASFRSSILGKPAIPV